MSFPRCFGIRLHAEFLEKYHLIGMQCRWESFDDKFFTKNLGKDFYHEDLISREGWARYYFKGKYQRDVAYVRLQIVNPSTGMAIRSFYFQFKKSYQMSLDARYYVTDPILEERIVKNGILIELRKFKKPDGTIVYKRANTTFKQFKIADVVSGNTQKIRVDTNAIIRTSVRYTEKPKMVFLVTPPHLIDQKIMMLYTLQFLIVGHDFIQSSMMKLPCRS